ncbi:hypothetical protein MPSEU_000504700 [Mayamaea pseudoterrestris]|nr:hypothetical protein MPSEU_000504700 [Mayamaea pseudoterrestris]
MDRPTQTLDLPLDHDEEHPRRLLALGRQIIAYGGDDGTVALVERTSSSTHVARPIRRFDDDSVRVIGASDDGKRVVIGSDSGMVQVYSYDDYDANEAHPFISNSPTINEDAPDEDDLLMSQSDALGASYQGEQTFAGPSYEAPIRDVKFLPNSHFAVIATETALTIVNLESSNTLTENVQELETDVGVRGVTMIQTEENDLILSALDMNGRLTHYKISLYDDKNTTSYQVLEKEARLVIEKRDVGEMLGASAACRSSRPCWLQMADNRRAVLAVGGQTYLQLRALGTLKMELSEQDQPLSILDSETGGVQGHLDSIVLTETIGNDHVVSCGRDKRLVVWKLETRKDGSLQAHFVQELGNGELDSVPTDLLWFGNGEAMGESLFVTTAAGKLFVMENLSSITSKAAKKLQKNATAATQSEVDAAAAATPDDDEAFASKTTTETSNGDEDEELFGTDASSLPKNRFIDDEADDGGDEDDDDSVPGPPVRSHAISSFGHEYDEGSEGDEFDVEQYRLGNQRSTVAQPTMKLPDPQPAFAPSSTPLGMTRRFMCWNHIGTVTHIQGIPGVSRSSIDIDFAETLTHRPVNFTDNIGFILGSVGEDGAIFATDLAEDEDDADDNLNEVIDGLGMSEMTKAALKKSQQKRMKTNGSKATGSTIFFHRFDTFAAIRDKDWYLTLPDGERALGCACGEGWAAVMTSRRFLRLFSSGGNQGQVIWLPGEAVSIVGRGRFLAVFYHEASPMMDETQKLGCMFYDATMNRTIHKGSASCISSGSCLAWTGFTNEYSLVAMDNDGMISMLATSGLDDGPGGASWEWAPVLDTVGLRKSIDDSFWPITVYDGKLVCVPLKGGIKHPDATRRPVTTTVGLRLPLARGTLSAINALEELSVRADMAFNQKKLVHMLLGDEDEETETEMRTISAQLDKVTLKMFASMVEAGKLERALDLVDRLHMEKSFDLGMKIADRHHKLVDLIEEAKERRFGRDDHDQDDQELSDNDPFGETRGQSLDRQRVTPDAISDRKYKRAFDDINAADLKGGGGRQVRNRSAFT